MGYVDVRDVAILHLRAMKTPEADGKRFIAAHTKPAWMYEVAEVLSKAGYDKIKLKRIISKKSEGQNFYKLRC